MSNGLVDFTATILKMLFVDGPRHYVALEHPEDEGREKGTCPASIWQWPEMLDLTTPRGVQWSAVSIRFWCRVLKGDPLAYEHPLCREMLKLEPPIFGSQGD